MNTNDRNLELHSSRRAGGFTLLELIVTIAIMAMVLSFGVPAFEQAIADGRRTSDVNELLLSLNLARSEALKRNRHVTVCKSADGAACGDASTTWSDGWIVFVNNNSANVGSVEAGEEILLVKNGVSRSAVFSPDVAVANFAAFRPDGRVDSAAGFVWCDHRGAAYARGVFISATGRPTSGLERPDGTALACL